jgi:hypothetical protein
MKTHWPVPFLALLACSGIAMAQPATRTTLGWTILVKATPAADEQDPKDAGYRLYREGYSLILDEQWEAAREKFALLKKRYPRSGYLDEAQYWSAYALMQTDQRRALEEYRSFLRQFKGSNYFPDALADLAQIEVQLRTRAPRAQGQPIPEGEEGSFSYEVTVPPAIRNLEHRLQIMAERLPRVMIAPPPVAVHFNDTTLDRAVRIRIQAIAALSETKEDEKSYQTLRNIAADVKQPQPVRIVAMNSLAGLRKHDVLPVLVNIARADTSRAMKFSAISMICIAGHDRDRRVESLEQIFQSLPPDREQLLSSTLYAIAEVGNDRAVDFLGRVAATHASYDLRGDAVFFLGNIGTEKARAALFHILQGEGR